MGYGLAFVPQLLVYAAIGQMLCANSSRLKDTTKLSKKSEQGAITAKLIRWDQYFPDKTVCLKHSDKVERDANRSKLRVQSLVRKRKLEAKAAATSIANPYQMPGSAEWETPLSDAAFAEYLMEISIGTPAQSFVAIADTGSDLTWLQCTPCERCSGTKCGACQGSLFDPKKSSTYAPLACSSTMGSLITGPGYSYPVPARGGCEYGFSYFDGSQTRGNIAQDTITLQTEAGDIQAVADFWFGCSHKEASNSGLLDVTDGLVGLGRGNVSFPSQLGTYFGRKFGYCLVNRSISTTVEYSPMFFGEAAVPATSVEGERLQYTPMITHSSTFYYVGCTGITLDGKIISSIPASAFDIQKDGSGGFIFDSGTTYTALWENIFNPLSDALQQQITTYTADATKSSGFRLCYAEKWNDWINEYGKSVPMISFQLANTSGFTLAVDTAWIKLDDSTVCLAMQSISSRASFLGSYQQVGYHVLFDLWNEQIGFIKTNCTATDTGQLFEASNSHTLIATLGSSQFSGPLSLLFILMLTQWQLLTKAVLNW